MQNLTLTLIKEYPFIFKNTIDFPVFDSPTTYIEYFQKRNKTNFIMFSFPDMFKLDILKECGGNIYNSFHTVKPDGTVNLLTYLQFDSYNHVIGAYFKNKQEYPGIQFMFYSVDNQFPRDFILKYENLIVQEDKAVGFTPKFFDNK